MKILITGANGFIGSYLANFLLKKNYQVIASARNFHASTKEILSGAELISLDVLNNDQLNQFALAVDVIIHTATANDIISKDVLKGIELSAIGTKNILDFSVKNNIPKCIIFSTFQVYGTELLGCIDEQSPLLYQNDYGLNHLFGEMYAEMYSRQSKVQCVIVRPANVYGNIITEAFNRWSLVPGCFCKEAHEYGKITIKSSGKQMRNFINLENLSRAIECILQYFPNTYECFNLASSNAETMLQVAEKVKLQYEVIYQKPLKIEVVGNVPVETNYFYVDLNKIKQIGFSEDDRFTIESTIQQIFNYLKLK